MVLHAWWGLNDTIRAVCDRLAEAGFVVFAPDLYHGKVTDTIEGAESLSNALDSESAKSDLAAAVAFLAEHESQISPAAGEDKNIAVVGFSLGASYRSASLRCGPQAHQRGRHLLWDPTGRLQPVTCGVLGALCRKRRIRAAE